MTNDRQRTDGNAAAHRNSDEDITRIFLRPIGSPLALGFLGLGGATIVLSALQLGWIPLTQSAYVAIALLVFGAPLQIIACIFSFLARDAAVATGMGILSATWFTTGLVKLNSPPAAHSPALGVFLIFAGAALLIPALGGVFGKIVPAIVLFTAAVRFFLTGVYQLSGGPGWQYVAGIAGLALLILAYYAALALTVEDVSRKTVLPVFRLGAGKRSLAGDMGDQVEKIEHEAGVREQL